MKKLIKNLCTEFSGDSSTINILEYKNGITLSTFTTVLSCDKAERLRIQYKCFTKETDPSIDEWVVYVLDAHKEYFELYETSNDFVTSQMVMNARLVNPHEPMIFLIQRKAAGLLVGFAVTSIDQNGMRIEVNLHGRPPILN